MMHMPKSLWIERFAERLDRLAPDHDHDRGSRAAELAALLYPQASDLVPEAAAETYVRRELGGAQIDG